jgi:hypothetical protein
MPILLHPHRVSLHTKEKVKRGVKDVSKAKRILDPKALDYKTVGRYPQVGLPIDQLYSTVVSIRQ